MILKYIYIYIFRVLGDYRVEPYYSVYKPPTPFKPGDVQSITFTGFIPASFVRSSIEKLRYRSTTY